jgi:hypothetical protein
MHNEVHEASGLLQLEAKDSSSVKCAVEQRFPELRLVSRHRFVMDRDLARLVTSKSKITTIRYEHSGVEYPASLRLPLFTADQKNDSRELRVVGDLQIRQLEYKYIDQLDDTDARADGFPSRQELIAALNRFYGPLTKDDLVCIYSFEYLKPVAESVHISKPKSISRFSAR